MSRALVLLVPPRHNTGDKTHFTTVFVELTGAAHIARSDEKTEVTIGADTVICEVTGRDGKQSSKTMSDVNFVFRVTADADIRVENFAAINAPLAEETDSDGTEGDAGSDGDGAASDVG
eukprot:gene6466-2362_t